MDFRERFLGKSQLPQPSQATDDFASQLQSRIDGDLESKRQRELQRKRATEEIQAAEAARQRESAQAELQFEQKKADALVEALQILDRFQIEQKLINIQRTVWRGKGRIRNVEPEFEVGKYTVTGIHADYHDVLGGLELVHQYTLPEHESTTPMSEDGPLSPRWRWVPRTSSTRLSVRVLLSHGSREGEKTLAITSSAETNEAGNIPNEGYAMDQKFPYFISYGSDRGLGNISIFGAANIPITSEDLDRHLLQETEVRLAHNLLPSHLEQRAGKFLAEAKAKPTWNRWVVHDSR